MLNLIYMHIIKNGKKNWKTKMAKEKLNGYFHGTLEVIIHKATIPTSCFCSAFRQPAFVSVDIDGTTVAETTRSADREWNECFRILCANPAGAVVTVALRTGMHVLGRFRIPGSVLQRCMGERREFHGMGKVKLEFSLQFRSPAEASEMAASFPERRNCGVVLYQDAHHGGGFRPPSRLGGEVREYRPRRLWEDVFRVIDGAKHLVFIAGWSLNPKLVLVRDPDTEVPKALGVALGDLLKRKADEGVTVRILLWNDETSLPIIKNHGLMRTHDEESLIFFRRTNVLCRLCPRLHHHHPSLFTHHQKTITADASPSLVHFLGLLPSALPPADSPREILSFVGGIDLCDGRYDTERHHLFPALDPRYFYQPSIAGACVGCGGPRQPWHDAHACVAGPAARDVLANFQQRWDKQCGSVLPIPSSIAAEANGNWTVQVFRSIDRISADGLPEGAASEHSIHDAYVSAIRRAERFVYIENQYFMGGCDLWDRDKSSGCRNLIPAEIALKIAEKIRAGEPFAAYVVVPMWPEGSPDGEAVQDMLHWTRLTMGMMYRVVGEAIRESGAGAVRFHPRDYLNFFCLANREERRDGEHMPPSSPPHGSHYWRAQKNRRFMIYVHSKLMIVDDEYILIGSANLNQRSMDGERDTEIAIGCRQTDCVGGSGKGDIFDFRMSLWYEHTYRIEEAFTEPWSVQCVKSLRGIGDEMWKRYSGEEVIDMENVHLVSYPVAVSEDGMVEDLHEGGGVFPDTTVLVSGKRSQILPPFCTT